MRRGKEKFNKIYKEWKDASPSEVWEGVRDNFIFGIRSIGMD